MEVSILIIIALLVSINLLMSIFEKRKHSEFNKSENKENVIEIIKSINEENEKSRTSFSSQISEFRKEFNEIFINLLSKNSSDQQANIKIINEQLDKIRLNLENKLSGEFDRVNKSFLTNNESLQKISLEFLESEKKITKTINESLNDINVKVENRLAKGFEDTNKTFVGIMERLAKIDEAQKKIESLSTEIISLQDIFTDKKARGSFGEVQLEMLLSSTFGENNKSLYEVQKVLSNNNKVDAFIRMPKDYGGVSVDSKFPLENYQKMKEKNSTPEQIEAARKSFKNDVKKHIDDISSKYIIENETAPQAVMFIPSEAIFAEINAYYDDLIVYAGKNNILITSPTTLMAFLKVVVVSTKEYERDKNSKLLSIELNKLAKEFERYSQRWTSLQKDIKKVSEDVEEINTTTEKITKKFVSISNVSNVKELENDESGT